MNNLSLPTKMRSIDFKVNATTGEAFISIRKTAELLNMADTTLRDQLKSAHPNFDRKQGLTPEILQKTVISRALTNCPIALVLLDKLSEAGAKAFIYHEAGVVISAVTQQPRPLTYIESLELLLESEKAKEALRIENLNQAAVIDDKKIRTDDSMTHTTMSRVRKLNTGKTYSSLKLTAYCEDNELNIEKVYNTYDEGVNSYPNEAWENVYPDAILPAHL